ncbi:unnamed protein product [Ceutorhynchus assimilis]|uniref:Uncharacterized protein n=1 Tax=Ceutorhynchus assimilis TaxID=467358 RepID=A0A9N9N253_9CUCU|nr:unnamed protein product [Ceutorhynchus assimilis]
MGSIKMLVILIVMVAVLNVGLCDEEAKDQQRVPRQLANAQIPPVPWPSLSQTQLDAILKAAQDAMKLLQQLHRPA